MRQNARQAKVGGSHREEIGRFGVCLRRRGIRVSRATIYRTLDHLIGSGLVWKTSLDTG